MGKGSIASKKTKRKNSNYHYNPSTPEVKKQKRISRFWLTLAICLLVAAAAIVIILSVKNSRNQADTEAAETTAAAETTDSLEPTNRIEIDIEGYGTIKAELYGGIAPQTVANFIALAESGFYDGLTFHRIIDGFMIQGGDPLGNGTGGSDTTIKGEFLENGVENPISHTRGVLSMARSQDYDSASSQFFIMQSDGTYLDGQYAAFGMVTEGMEIVDQICKDTPVQDSNGTVLAEDQPVITAIRVVE